MYREVSQDSRVTYCPGRVTYGEPAATPHVPGLYAPRQFTPLLSSSLLRRCFFLLTTCTSSLMAHTALLTLQANQHARLGCASHCVDYLARGHVRVIGRHVSGKTFGLVFPVEALGATSMEINRDAWLASTLPPTGV